MMMEGPAEWPCGPIALHTHHRGSNIATQIANFRLTSSQFQGISGISAHVYRVCFMPIVLMRNGLFMAGLPSHAIWTWRRWGVHVKNRLLSPIGHVGSTSGLQPSLPTSRTTAVVDSSQHNKVRIKPSAIMEGEIEENVVTEEVAQMEPVEAEEVKAEEGKADEEMAEEEVKDGDAEPDPTSPVVAAAEPEESQKSEQEKSAKKSSSRSRSRSRDSSR